MTLTAADMELLDFLHNNSPMKDVMQPFKTLKNYLAARSRLLVAAAELDDRCNLEGFFNALDQWESDQRLASLKTLHHILEKHRDGLLAAEELSNNQGIREFDNELAKWRLQSAGLTPK